MLEMTFTPHKIRSFGIGVVLKRFVKPRDGGYLRPNLQRDERVVKLGEQEKS